MGDVAVENPANTVAPHRKPLVPDSIPGVDLLEGGGVDEHDEYAMMKRLQRHIEYVWLLFYRWS